MKDPESFDLTAARAWAGIDIGKTHHWVCVVDDAAGVLMSRKVINDEQDLATVIAAVEGCAATVVWAIDIVGAPSALLLSLLAAGERDVRYASGRMVNALSVAFTGEGKTDAKDAHVIADVARMRPDLPAIGPASDVVRDLALLISHRADLTADRVRMINRLRNLLTSVFPALEREFSFKSHKGAVVLLTKYSTPAAIRRTGHSRLTAWLQQRHVRDAAGVATRALKAASTQHVTLPGSDTAAAIVSELATTPVGPGRADPPVGRTTRCPVPRSPTVRDHHLDARFWSRPGLDADRRCR